MLTEAPEVEELANVLIDILPEFEHLRLKPIAYAFSDKSIMVGGTTAIGKAVKSPTVWKGDGLADFKVIIHGPTWTSMSTEQKQALLHHELMHCDYKTVEKKRKGTVETVPCIRRHDLEEFSMTRKRFGDWYSNHQYYAQIERETVDDVINKGDHVESGEPVTSEA